MFNKRSSVNGTMPPFTVNLVKITVILFFFCFAQCAAGSCLNYGHACWGAHGKRSENQNSPVEDESSNKDIKSKWFLSRLIQNPLDLGYTPERDLDLSAKYNSDPLFPANEGDNLSGQDWEDPQNMFADPRVEDILGRLSRDSNRIRSSKLLNKRSTKHN